MVLKLTPPAPEPLPVCTHWNGAGIGGYVQHHEFGIGFQLAHPMPPAMPRGRRSYFVCTATFAAADARAIAAELLAHADAWDALYGPTPAPACAPNPIGQSGSPA